MQVWQASLNGRKPGPYQWYEIQDAIDYFEKFEQPKIVYPDIAKESRATLDKSGCYLGNTAYFLPTDDLFLLGILNSKLIFAYFKRQAAVLGDADKGGRLRWFSQDVLKIPICNLKKNTADKAKKTHFISLVKQLIELHKQLDIQKMPEDKKQIKRQINAISKELDEMVYSFYGVSVEEAKLIDCVNDE